jgi:hypothetical protein
METNLLHRLTDEFIGTAILLAAVIGSGTIAWAAC